MFTAASLIIAEKQNQLKCPYRKWGVAIQWSIIQPLKRDLVLIHATTRINLKNIMLSGRSQVTNSHILYDCLHEISKIRTYNRKERVVAGRKGRREWLLGDFYMG